MSKAKQRLASVLVLLAMVVGMAAPVAWAAEGEPYVDYSYSEIGKNGWIYGSASEGFQAGTNTTVKEFLVQFSEWDNFNWDSPIYALTAEQEENFHQRDNAEIDSQYQKYAAQGLDLSENNNSAKAIETRAKVHKEAYEKALRETGTLVQPSDIVQNVQGGVVYVNGTLGYNEDYYASLRAASSSSSGSSGGSSSGGGSGGGSGAMLAVAGIGAAVIGGGIIAATVFPASAIGQAVLQLGESLHLVPAGTAAQKLAEAGAAAQQAAKPLAVQQSTASAANPAQSVYAEVKEDTSPESRSDMQQRLQQLLGQYEPSFQIIDVTLSSNIVPMPVARVAVPIQNRGLREAAVYRLEADGSLTALASGGGADGSYQIEGTDLVLYTSVSGRYVAVCY